MKYDHEKTAEVLRVFEEIARIPRCSKHEEKIGQWLMEWADSNGFNASQDRVGSVLIKVPATAGFENAPIVVLQGHMDMVCEKTKDSDHDFSKDPIKFVFEGDWLTADRTTLGADNGIALAMAMVMAKEAPHPALELLFTVDEETGLTGANALEPGFIEGKVLINIDSEDEGVFTVGCAGGINTHLGLPLNFVPAEKGMAALGIEVGGLKGGHSGIDIGLEKGNAIVAMARVLRHMNKTAPVFIADMKGGSAHNAIPRDCESVVLIPEENVDQAVKSAAEFEKILAKEFQNTEPGLQITVKRLNECPEKMADQEASVKAIRFILAMPHGVAAMSTDIKDLIETSNNFANVKIADGELQILSSQRSSVVSRLEKLTAKIEAVAQIAGGWAKSGEGYPPWPPDMDSPLLKLSIDVYKKLFNKEPIVEVIHAGLECGIIGDKNPGMDMISIGPTLKYPHSPDEKVCISDIGKIWDLIVGIFNKLKS